MAAVTQRPGAGGLGDDRRDVDDRGGVWLRRQPSEHALDLRRGPHACAARRLDAAIIKAGCDGPQ